MDDSRGDRVCLILGLGLLVLLSACGDSLPQPESEAIDEALRRSFASAQIDRSPLGASVRVSSRLRSRISGSQDVTRSRFVTSRATRVSPSMRTLQIQLFDDVEFDVTRTTSKRESDGTVSWTGHIDGFLGHPVNFVRRGNNLFGKLVHGDHVYVVQSVSSGVLAVQEISRLGSAPCGNGLNLDRGPRFADSVVNSRLDFKLTGTIDLMVAYTAETTGGTSFGAAMMQLQIQIAVIEMNNALERSDIRHRVRLVHTMELDGTDIENASSSTQLAWIKEKMNDASDEVYEAREAYKADVVSLWVEKSSNACGRGYVYDLRENFDEWATHMVVRSCQLSKYSFLHEFGHNLGGNHDWAVSTATEPYIYSHGYALWDVDFPMIPVRTLMAYDDICDYVGVECPRVPVFSNPDFEILGYPFGFGYADVHRTINNTGYRVSKFR